MSGRACWVGLVVFLAFGPPGARFKNGVGVVGGPRYLYGRTGDYSGALWYNSRQYRIDSGGGHYSETKYTRSFRGRPIRGFAGRFLNDVDCRWSPTGISFTPMFLRVR